MQHSQLPHSVTGGVMGTEKLGRLQEEVMPKVRVGLRTRQAGEAVGGRGNLAGRKTSHGKEGNNNSSLEG